MENYLLILIFAPLLASLFAGLFSQSAKKTFIGIINSCLIFISFICAIFLLGFVWTNGSFSVELFKWIEIGNLSIPFSFVADEISLVMATVVLSVSTIVHVYSIGYMAHDKSFNRFFAYLSAFVFSMLILVMSDNFAGLFIGWEGVGLCSYLLIGFWYEKHSASFAANEAFIMNRIADLGMLLGIIAIYWQFGSLNYSDVFANLASVSTLDLNIIAALLFVGAMGKSAQFPLHTWLADAMEGPTPVSALIHAATMVTAGVYLVVRANAIYSMSDVGIFIAFLGAFVALFAASMALVNKDLKRVIAYSTLSQLGYMFVAAGLGAYWVALFHLATHAFFKALLFLGAGNVMHAMNDELDMTKMGALYKPLKPTAIMMILASIALAGIYPFAGFFSKDKILEAAFGYGYYGIWAVLLLAAIFTAFYSFRLISLVFFGKDRHSQNGVHPHEMPVFVLIAMSFLAIMAVIGGFFEHGFKNFVSKLLPLDMPHLDHSVALGLIALTTIVVLASIGFALYKYKKGGFSDKWQNNFLYKLLLNNYYIPNFYNIVFIGGYKKLSHFAWVFVDKKIIDLTVDGVAKLTMFTAKISRIHHNGNLSSMLRLMGLGLAILVLVAVFLVNLAQG